MLNFYNKNTEKSFIIDDSNPIILRRSLFSFVKQNARFIKKIFRKKETMVYTFVLSASYSCSGSQESNFLTGNNSNDFLGNLEVNSDQKINGAGGDDYILTGDGNDSIRGGIGNDIIETSGGTDVIRAGRGRDTVFLGDENDVYVAVGITGEQEYTAEDIDGILGDIVNLGNLNRNGVSELEVGDSIDGGEGVDTLILYGEVDLEGVLISNIENLRIHSRVTLTNNTVEVEGDTQSVLANINSITGDNRSVLVIEDSGNLRDFIPENTIISGIQNIIVNNGITLTITTQEELDLLEQVGILELAGNLVVESSLNIEGLVVSNLDNISGGTGTAELFQALLVIDENTSIVQEAGVFSGDVSITEVNGEAYDISNSNFFLNQGLLRVSELDFEDVDQEKRFLIKFSNNQNILVFLENSVELVEQLTLNNISFSSQNITTTLTSTELIDSDDGSPVETVTIMRELVSEDITYNITVDEGVDLVGAEEGSSFLFNQIINSLLIETDSFLFDVRARAGVVDIAGNTVTYHLADVSVFEEVNNVDIITISIQNIDGRIKDYTVPIQVQAQNSGTEEVLITGSTLRGGEVTISLIDTDGLSEQLVTFLFSGGGFDDFIRVEQGSEDSVSLTYTIPNELLIGDSGTAPISVDISYEDEEGNINHSSTDIDVFNSDISLTGSLVVNNQNIEISGSVITDFQFAQDISSISSSSGLSSDYLGNLSPTLVAGVYGDFILEFVNGSLTWNYQLRNLETNYIRLSEGETIFDEFTINTERAGSEFFSETFLISVVGVDDKASLFNPIVNLPNNVTEDSSFIDSRGDSGRTFAINESTGDGNETFILSTNVNASSLTLTEFIGGQTSSVTLIDNLERYGSLTVFGNNGDRSEGEWVFITGDFYESINFDTQSALFEFEVSLTDELVTVGLLIESPFLTGTSSIVTNEDNTDIVSGSLSFASGDVGNFFINGISLSEAGDDTTILLIGGVIDFGSIVFTINAEENGLDYIYTPTSETSEVQALAVGENLQELITFSLTTDGKTQQQDFVVVLRGENDEVIFEEAQRFFSIQEDNNAIGTVSAIDTDSFDVLTYSLLNTAGLDTSLFSIDSNTGALSFVSTPNFELLFDSLRTEYTTVVEVSDANNTTATQTITVDITNNTTDDNQVFLVPSDLIISLSDTIVGIQDSTSRDKLEYQFSAISVNGGDITYSLSSDSSGLFNLTSGGILTLDKPLFFEQGVTNQYVISVGLEENGELNSEQVTIVIEDGILENIYTNNFLTTDSLDSLIIENMIANDDSTTSVEFTSIDPNELGTNENLQLKIDTNVDGSSIPNVNGDFVSIVTSDDFVFANEDLVFISAYIDRFESTSMASSLKGASLFIGLQELGSTENRLGFELIREPGEEDFYRIRILQEQGGSIITSFSTSDILYDNALSLAENGEFDVNLEFIYNNRTGESSLLASYYEDTGVFVFEDIVEFNLSANLLNSSNNLTARLTNLDNYLFSAPESTVEHTALISNLSLSRLDSGDDTVEFLEKNFIIEHNLITSPSILNLNRYVFKDYLGTLDTGSVTIQIIGEDESLVRGVLENSTANTIEEFYGEIEFSILEQNGIYISNDGDNIFEFTLQVNNGVTSVSETVAITVNNNIDIIEGTMEVFDFSGVTDTANIDSFAIETSLASNGDLFNFSNGILSFASVSVVGRYDLAFTFTNSTGNTVRQVLTVDVSTATPVEGSIETGESLESFNQGVEQIDLTSNTAAIDINQIEQLEQEISNGELFFADINYYHNLLEETTTLYIDLDNNQVFNQNIDFVQEYNSIIDFNSTDFLI